MADSRILIQRFIILIFLFMPFTTLPARAVTQESAGPVPGAYFCMHVHHKPGFETAFKDVPFKILRLWDTSIGWPLLEPENDTWNWDLLDEYVALAQDSGAALLMPLGMTPLWAASQPDAPSPYSGCSSSPPTDIEDWKDYVRTLAVRNRDVYGGAIKYWEIWNEPDNIHGGFSFYSGTAAELAELAVAAADIIREVDPGNVMLGPGITQVGDGWLDDFLSAGGAQAVDIIGFHYYWDWFSPRLADFRAVADKVKAVAEKHGFGHAPLWVTETGLALSNYKTWSERQAAMAATVIVPRAYGADTACTYAWNNSMFSSMFDVDAQQTTPTFDTWITLRKWLYQAVVKDLSLGKKKFIIATLGIGNAEAHIVWRASAKAAAFTVPPDWGDHYARTPNDLEPLPPDRTIEVDGAPVLIFDEALAH